MFNIGASDAGLFAKACDEMTERARKLGPNPLKEKRSRNTTNTQCQILPIIQCKGIRYL